MVMQRGTRKSQMHKAACLTPNTKHQTPNTKRQTPNAERQTGRSADLTAKLHAKATGPGKAPRATSGCGTPWWFNCISDEPIHEWAYLVTVRLLWLRYAEYFLRFRANGLQLFSLVGRELWRRGQPVRRLVEVIPG